MSVTGLDHDNARSLRDIARALQDMVKQEEERRRLAYERSDVLPGIAESLAEVSQNTGRIAEALEAQPKRDPAIEHLLHQAWGVIANAGWDGDDKTPGWQEAAVRWRDAYHVTLAEGVSPGVAEA